MALCLLLFQCLALTVGSYSRTDTCRVVNWLFMTASRTNSCHFFPESRQVNWTSPEMVSGSLTCPTPTTACGAVAQTAVNESSSRFHRFRRHCPTGLPTVRRSHTVIQKRVNPGG